MACNEKYPKPQTGPCPFCEEPDPEWQDWSPVGEEIDSIIEMGDLLVGLLDLLEGCGHLQDRDGRLYGAVADALRATSQMPLAPFQEVYQASPY